MHEVLSLSGISWSEPTCYCECASSQNWLVCLCVCCSSSLTQSASLQGCQSLTAKCPQLWLYIESRPANKANHWGVGCPWTPQSVTRHSSSPLNSSLVGFKSLDKKWNKYEMFRSIMQSSVWTLFMTLLSCIFLFFNSNMSNVYVLQHLHISCGSISICFEKEMLAKTTSS